MTEPHAPRHVDWFSFFTGVGWGLLFAVVLFWLLP